MANTMQVTDVYALMNSIVSQATGRTDLTAVDTSSFTAVGETVLRQGTEDVLNAISQTLAKTIFSVRPYKAKFSSLVVDSQRWGGQIRKIVTLYDEAEQSQDHNTDIDSPLNDGGSVDMYRIRKPKAMQLNFYGTKVLQKHITRFRDQLSLAFSNESEFMRFIDAIMTEFFNEVELLNEEKSRLTVINHMAGLIAMKTKGTVVDLRAEFNAKYGTEYTRDELLSTHLEEFMKFMAAQIKIYSSRLTDMSVNYHKNITGKGSIMRHTPKAKQKMLMYEPLFIETEAQVYSSLFNPQYLDIGTFEGVNYWQSQNEPTKILAKPNILSDTGESATAENTQHDFIVGMLFDEEALGVVPQFDYTSVTPFNAAGGYYNMYMHWRFNSYNDFTENAILFVIG